MPAEPPTEDERKRLEAVRRYASPDPVPDPDLAFVVECAASLCGAPLAALGLVEEDVVRLEARRGIRRAALPRPGSVFARIVAGRAPLRLRDLGPADPLASGRAPARACAGVPLLSPDGQAVGALVVLDRSRRSFPAARVRALESLARQAVALLELRVQRRATPERESLARAAQGGRGDLGLFEALAASLLGGGELASPATASALEACDAAIRALFVVPEIDHCALYLLDAGRSEARLALWYGYEQPHARIGMEERSIITHVLRAGEPWISPDVDRDPHYLKASSTVRSEAAFPLHAGGDVAGVLNVESTRPAAFRPGLLALCDSIASGIEAALEGTSTTEKMLRAKIALERTFDALPELIAIVDGEGRIQRLNQAMALRLGGLPRDLVGASLPERFPPCREWLAASEASPLQPQSGWKEVVDAAEQRVYEANLLRLASRQPQSGDRVALFRDVTEDRRLSARVIAYERRAAVGDLVSGLAHEVRNPLTAIQAAAQMLPLEAPHQPGVARLVGIISRQSERLTGLARDLLDLVRGSGTRPERSSLAAVARIALQLWRETPTHEAWPVAHEAVADEQVMVEMDTVRVERAIINLLDNAAQHSEAAAPIAIRVGREGGECVLSVSDQGRGAPPEVLARMFEPFFTTRTGGTGLGLAIVTSAVESHGGRVTAVSNAPRPGLTITLRLPAAHA